VIAQIKEPVSFQAVLSAPPVWGAPASASDDSGRNWVAMKKLVGQAIADLVRGRAREGAGIQKDILARLDTIQAASVQIRVRSPLVLQAYQKKLDERISSIVAARGIDASKADLAKEIALFADKSDISEELQRLEAHVGSCREIVAEAGSIGRRLDFLTQEMRETNTASKGGDAGISGGRRSSELERSKSRQTSNDKIGTKADHGRRRLKDVQAGEIRFGDHRPRHGSEPSRLCVRRNSSRRSGRNSGARDDGSRYGTQAAPVARCSRKGRR
jgi:hypothetical protein